MPQFFFGVVPTAPGFAALDVKPQPGPVLAGNATLPTVRGPLRVAFRQTLPAGGCFDLEIETPGGAIARAFLPRWGKSVSVKLDGAAVEAAEDGDFARVDGIAPGAHTLTTC